MSKAAGMTLGQRAGVLLCLIMFAAALGEAGAQGLFAEAIPDLPLMEGLTEDAEAVVFDKPSGRIVEMGARGAVSRDEVQAFYDKTLPALGWQAMQTGRYRREGESLTLSFRAEGDVLLVRFVLAPDS